MMKTIIVSSEDEAAAAQKKMLEEGYRVASVSNTGLAPGKARITFLPHSAFEETNRKEAGDA